jgi:transketolase
MRNTFVDTIIAKAQTRADLFMISGDAGLGVFDDFQLAHPDKFINLGVAEQNTTSFAAGLALSGFKVYIYNIIPFVLYRCYEQVRNDICYQRLPVVMVGIGSGLTYAPQGMTHYSIEDIGLCRTLPNLRVFSPIDPVEARLVAEYSLSSMHPVYVRLPKKGEPVYHHTTQVDITMPCVLRDGSDVALVFHGSISQEAVKAADMLASGDRHVRLMSVPLIQPFPRDAFMELTKDVKHVVVVEEHYKGSGLGSIIAVSCNHIKPKWQLHVLGIPDRFIHEVKDNAGMREHFGISASKIASYIKEILEV